MTRTHRAAAWLALALLSALVLLVTVRAQEAGTLVGRVTNGTSGGPEVGAGITVTLHVFQGENELDPRQTTTDAAGGFRFEGLDPDPALSYWPEATYQGVPFSSAEPYSFEARQTLLETAVSVYEATVDDAAIQLQSVHVIAESFGQVLRISEIQLFGNSGDRAYVGEGGRTVFIPLPAGAVGLAFSEGDAVDRYVEAEDGVWDTEPVPPGSQGSLAFLSYHVLVVDGTVTLERRFAYPVADFNILVAQPGLTLESEQLKDGGTQLFQNQQYGFYTAENLGTGQVLSLKFGVQPEAGAMPETGTAPDASGAETAPPAAGPPRGSQPVLRILGFGLALLAVLAALLYPGVARRRAPAAAGSRLDSPGQRRLLAELAELEAAWEQGRVDEASYVQKRAELYEALR